MKLNTSVLLYRTAAIIAIAILALATLPVSPAYALACTSNGSGNWNAAATWTGCGGGVPGAADTVTIQNGHNITVTANASATSITFPTNNGTNTTLTINSGVTLTVSGAVTIPRAGSGNMNTVAVGAGTLSAGSIAFTSSGGNVRHQLTISTGTVTVSGDVTVAQSGDTSGTISFSGAGTLKVGGALWDSSSGTLTIFSGSTVEYNGGAAQTVKPAAYSNLVLSGSSAKTLSSGTSTTANLSIAPTGSATASIQAGQNLSVNSLTLGGLGRVNGTWGSTSSTATNQNNTYFAATTGRLNVTTDTRVTPTVSVTNSPVTYDGTSKSASVSGSVAGTVSDIRYNGSTTAPTNAGTYTITADFAPTDLTSYKSLANASAGSFVINQASQATLTAVVTPSTVVYGSTATLSSTGGSGTGAVTFSAGASTGCSVSGTTLSVTNASGTCSITATKAADTNYLVATSAAASVTLQKAATITTVTGGTFTYDGASHPATVTVTGPGGLSLTPSATYSGSCSAAPATVAEGTSCTASYNYTGSSNYLSSSDSAGITITAKTASVTPDADSKVYGSADPTFTGTLSGFLPADSVTASYGREVGETVAASPYTINAELSPAGVLPNYDITYNTASFTITAKPASVSPAAASKTYGDDDPALTGSLSGFLPADNVSAIYSREAGETVAGSPYTISATLSPAGVLPNYDITYNTASFTIDPKAASVTPDPDSKVYGAANPTLTGTLSGFLPADSVTATYSREAGETVAGSPYTISATLSPAGVLPNYTITYNTANFTITEKALTITGLTADHKVYDGSNAATLSGTAALVGVVTGDAVNVSGTPAATFNNANVGDNKPVTVTGYTLSGADAGNYTVSQPIGLTANITAASVNVTGITAGNKVYDGDTTAALNTGSANLVGVIGGDTVNLDDSAAAGVFADKNVGTGKTVTVSGLALTGADAGNYLLTQPTATADITARDLTVTAAGVNRAYNGTTTATVTLSSDAILTDTLTLNYTSAAFADKNVGTNKSVAVDGITIGGADAGNYNLLNTTANTTADITAFAIEVNAHAKTKFVGMPDPALTYSAVPSLFSGDTFTGALTRTAGEAVGQYPIQQGTLAAGGNYNITFVSADLNIVAITTSNLDVYIGGNLKKSYQINPTSSTRDSYAGVNAGPVKVISTNGVPVMAAERVIYRVNGVDTSFSEMMGLPDSQLDNTYWLPWYNSVDLNTQLRIANVSGSTATVNVSIGGTPVTGSPFTLAPGASARKSFPGVNKGPVKIESNVNIVAAERVIYKVNGADTSFTEMMALPNSRLDTTYWFPWYNNVDLDTQLRFANVSGSTATVNVSIGGTPVTGSPFTLAPGASARKSFSGVNKGPVKIESNANIVVAERVIQKVNGTAVSYSEMMGLPNSQLDNTYWLPWYNNVDLDTQLRIANVGNATAQVHVYIGNSEVAGSPFTLAPGASARKTYPANKGPVKVISTQNLVVAERVIYKVNGAAASFTEMMGLPNSLLDAIYWLPWYNNQDLNTQLRFGVP